MKKPLETTQKSQKNTVQRIQQETSAGGSATIADNRPETIQQRKVKTAIDTSVSNTLIIQQKQSLVPSNRVTSPSLSNQTGLPNKLKSGIENLSGFSMDDVKVHYNSNKPAQLQAHAYAQGTDIHLAPNQEKHLPHEAWHVVQQKQGRVQPTKQLKSKVHINDDAGLEREADVMGAKALQLKSKEPKGKLSLQQKNKATANFSTTQLKTKLSKEIDSDGFNVIGENHGETKGKRKDDEELLVQHIFKNKNSYLLEQQLKIPSGNINKIEFGDPMELRFLFLLSYIYFNIQTVLEEIKKISSINMSNVNNTTEKKHDSVASFNLDNFIASDEDKDTVRFNTIKSIVIDELKDINKTNFQLELDSNEVGKRRYDSTHSNLTSHATMLHFHKNISILHLSLAYLFKEPAITIGDKIGEIIPNATKLISEIDVYLKANGPEIRNSKKPKELRKELISKRRSVYMHKAANIAQNINKKGVWKIGEDHVSHIVQMGDMIANFKQDYTLIDRASFNETYYPKKEGELF